MADPNGFLSQPRADAAKRAVDERLGNWLEVCGHLRPWERDGHVRAEVIVEAFCG
ncbi:hypothetical protein V5P93_005343 [Actinokineospora auranticolor]|uniref:Uncharacterized protein n=1 Tax=Actinokineospora auranticolor TaxID=155976 RepID=A0A2S6GR02_9PSEU|nr:hypothetical protein [Actinokineospora auranticolor]PPK67629.1 hypothetical protein CLV40_107295 [Actinokineospora auranticolor]